MFTDIRHAAIKPREGRCGLVSAVSAIHDLTDLIAIAKATYWTKAPTNFGHKLWQNSTIAGVPGGVDKHADARWPTIVKSGRNPAHGEQRFIWSAQSHFGAHAQYLVENPTNWLENKPNILSENMSIETGKEKLR